MLTRNGIAVLVAAGLAVLAGLAVGYPLLVGLGVGCAVPPLVARAGWRRTESLNVTRVLNPDRVEVGETATSMLTISNDGSRRTRRMHATETIDDQQVSVDVPALDPGEASHTLTLELPTARRGVHQVGPLRFGRPDPFGFTSGIQTHSSTSRLTVLPRTHSLRPLGAGTARDLDGPTSDVAREGGIAFHGLRSYVAGDDIRLIDWRATARSAGHDLYVRQHVETVRPNLDVLIDTDARRYPGDAFELAVEIAASIVTSAIAAMHPVTLRTTSPERGSVHDGDGTASELLDALAALQPGGPGDLGGAVGAMGLRESGHSLVLVSGECDEDELLDATEHGMRFSRIVVVRADPSAARTTVGLLGRVLTLTANGGDAFAAMWNEQFA